MKVYTHTHCAACGEDMAAQLDVDAPEGGYVLQPCVSEYSTMRRMRVSSPIEKSTGRVHVLCERCGELIYERLTQQRLREPLRCGLCSESIVDDEHVRVTAAIMLEVEPEPTISIEWEEVLGTTNISDGYMCVDCAIDTIGADNMTDLFEDY